MNIFNQYSFYDSKYGESYGILDKTVCKVLSNSQITNQSNNKIAMIIKKNNVDENIFQKYRTLKYFNILQPQEYRLIQNEYYLIYFDLFQHRLNEQKLKHIIGQQGYRILLQLALTFVEFEKRKFNWPINNINQLYYIEGILYMSLLEYKFDQIYVQQNYLEIFKSFIKNYFMTDSLDLNFIQQMLKGADLNQIIQYLFEKNGNIHKQSLLFDPAYQKVLQYLLDVSQFTQIYNGNSVVKQFQKPKVFSYTFPFLKQEIVYKQTKIYGNSTDQQTLKQIQREIDLMELFDNTLNVVSCFTYLRVSDVSFLLFNKFDGNLSHGLEKWQNQQKTNDQIKKDVYTLASRTAQSLMCLHEKNIIHRDLKPENIFIDNFDFSSCQFYIADFDCSKQVQDKFNVTQTKQDSYTQKYDPPEFQQTLKYDIFQFGLILLSVANKGKYIGDELGPRNLSEQQFNSFYSRQAIEQRLSSINYDERFIEAIASCLFRDPNQRPDIKTLYDKLKKLNFSSKIKRTDESQPQQRLSLQFQLNQTNSNMYNSYSPLTLNNPNSQTLTPQNYRSQNLNDQSDLFMNQQQDQNSINNFNQYYTQFQPQQSNTNPQRENFNQRRQQ